ncbi:hypothetical protein MJO28_016916 [Puccinia striiformis f. sp. tritici]|nr:hypothetical protein MJO28_016916 [Puccinia striiformis f. sp. tritici]
MLPHSSLYVDESAVCDQDLLRTLARAPVGSSLARYITNQNPERLSKLPAIGMNGVLALTVRDNTFNTKKFQHFLELLPQMNPYPGPNPVLVCDNATICKGCRVRALCEEAGVRVICLPPYCPELNPIELCFARMKFRLQQMQELSYSLDTHWSIQTTFVDVITPEFCYDIYHHCGYHMPILEFQCLFSFAVSLLYNSLIV